MRTIITLALLVCATNSARATGHLHLENTSPEAITFLLEGIPNLKSVELSPNQSLTLRVVGDASVIELRSPGGFVSSKDKLVVIEMNSHSIEPGMKSGDIGVRFGATITVGSTEKKIVVSRKEK